MAAARATAKIFLFMFIYLQFRGMSTAKIGFRAPPAVGGEASIKALWFGHSTISHVGASWILFQRYSGTVSNRNYTTSVEFFNPFLSWFTKSLHLTITDGGNCAILPRSSDFSHAPVWQPNHTPADIPGLPHQTTRAHSVPSLRRRRSSTNWRICATTSLGSPSTSIHSPRSIPNR